MIQTGFFLQRKRMVLSPASNISTLRKISSICIACETEREYVHMGKSSAICGMNSLEEFSPQNVKPFYIVTATTCRRNLPQPMQEPQLQNVPLLLLFAAFSRVGCCFCGMAKLQFGRFQCVPSFLLPLSQKSCYVWRWEVFSKKCR